MTNTSILLFSSRTQNCGVILSSTAKQKWSVRHHLQGPTQVNILNAHETSPCLVVFSGGITYTLLLSFHTQRNYVSLCHHKTEKLQKGTPKECHLYQHYS